MIMTLLQFLQSYQRYSPARNRSGSKSSPARKGASGDKEFNQSELDQYIAKNDWNSVAQYIAVMRSASQDDRDKRQPRTPRRRRNDSASYSESPRNTPRKQVGARSQLQYSPSYESESDWETDSQATGTDGSDWESYTTGPSYYSNREARERRRNDNVPKRTMHV